MTAFAIAGTGPLMRLDFAFVQHLVVRLLATILAPDGHGDEAYAKHDRALLALPESLNPRRPADAAVASQFIAGHDGSMAIGQAAPHLPEAHRGTASLTSASLGHAGQAMRTLPRGQAEPGSRTQPHSVRRTGTTPCKAAITGRTAPPRTPVGPPWMQFRRGQPHAKRRRSPHQRGKRRAATVRPHAQ